MPTYQYRCRDCGDDLEVQQSFTDDPLTTCPSCQGSLRKVFSAVGISFKGSGFYKTDSRGGSSSTIPAASTDSGASSSTADSSSSGANGSSSSSSSEGSNTKSTESKASSTTTST